MALAQRIIPGSNLVLSTSIVNVLLILRIIVHISPAFFVRHCPEIKAMPKTFRKLPPAILWHYFRKQYQFGAVVATVFFSSWVFSLEPPEQHLECFRKCNNECGRYQRFVFFCKHDILSVLTLP
ncbi:MAG: hypothetical protein ACD_7C00184G0002 [uncultured bacterium]|nr:MAG: hypothetical protein ACD_7C00184G0002 [uncultured bacterium]